MPNRNWKLWVVKKRGGKLWDTLYTVVRVLLFETIHVNIAIGRKRTVKVQTTTRVIHCTLCTFFLDDLKALPHHQNCSLNEGYTIHKQQNFTSLIPFLCVISNNISSWDAPVSVNTPSHPTRIRGGGQCDLTTAVYCLFYKSTACSCFCWTKAYTSNWAFVLTRAAVFTMDAK